MKLLVLGAGGMAGHVVAIRLAEYGHNVIGFARCKQPFCETIVGDAMTANLPEIVCEYDAVINCIGVLNKAVDAETDRGIWLNSYLPHMLGRYANRVIHISSDCVFSGHDYGGYKETDFRSSDTLYGRSKALGELNDDHNLTIRTSIVGPDINVNGIGLFNWFMKQRGSVGGYTGAIWGGVSTVALADAIHVALEQDVTGLYHLTNGEKISKYELLEYFNKLRTEPVTIIPSDVVHEDKSLVSVRNGFLYRAPPYEEMVYEIGEWINVHKELYPQYDVNCPLAINGP